MTNKQLARKILALNVQLMGGLTGDECLIATHKIKRLAIELSEAILCNDEQQDDEACRHDFGTRGGVCDNCGEEL